MRAETKKKLVNTLITWIPSPCFVFLKQSKSFNINRNNDITSEELIIAI